MGDPLKCLIHFLGIGIAGAGSGWVAVVVHGEEEGEGEDKAGDDLHGGREMGVVAAREEVIAKEEEDIVGAVEDDCSPEATAPIEGIAEECAEQHARHKAEWLKMHEAEHKCSNPDGSVHLYAASGHQALEGAAED